MDLHASAMNVERLYIVLMHRLLFPLVSVSSDLGTAETAYIGYVGVPDI